MTTELLALADRVEAAKGPDRELDLEILHAAQAKRYRWAEFGGMVGLSDQRMIAVEVEPDWLTEEMHQWWFDQSDQRKVPAYTASLDAALSLVSDGAHVIELQQDGAHDWAWWCWIADTGRYEGTAQNASAPLAITAAALRALAHASRVGDGRGE